MRRFALIGLFLSLLIASPALAQNDDDSASMESTVEAGGDDSAPAVAEAPEITDEQAVAAVEDAVEAVQTKSWALGLSALLTLIVFAFRRFNLLKHVPPKAVPAVAVALGIAGDVVYSLSSGGSPSAAGTTIGLASVGVWEVLLKHLLKSRAPEVEDSE